MIVKTTIPKEGRKFIIRESISDKFVFLYNTHTRLEKVLKYFITVIFWSFAVFVKISFWLCIIEHGLTKLWYICFKTALQSTRTMHCWQRRWFNSFWRRVDIVLIKNGIRTSVDVVIVDSTWMDLLIRSCITQGFVAFDVAQA
jgi:hypothetical protein